MASFKLEIVTPDKVAYSGDAESAIVPSEDGYLGIMANHAPLLVELKDGLIEVASGGRKQFFATSGGFLEFLGNTATLLVRTCEAPGDIDAARAKEALERAKERLKTRDSGTDVDRAQSAIGRAIARMKLLEKDGK